MVFSHYFSHISPNLPLTRKAGLDMLCLSSGNLLDGPLCLENGVNEINEVGVGGSLPTVFRLEPRKHFFHSSEEVKLFLGRPFCLPTYQTF